jgi:hypothetical protein
MAIPACLAARPNARLTYCPDSTGRRNSVLVR